LDKIKFADSVITLPNGSNISLMGKIDVLHEELALAHGFKNDEDLPFLAEAMSPFGIIMLGSKLIHAIPEETEEEYAFRKEAHRIGMQRILNEGFEQLTYPKAVYNVYTALNSLAVDLNT